jgi:hypothetical protein
MATTVQTIITKARIQLLELSARFWTDQELLDHYNDGVKDLWKGIIDLYKDHFIVQDVTNMQLPASTSGGSAVAVTGVPAALFRILIIRPRVLGSGSANQGLVFEYRDRRHPQFVQAEAAVPISPRQAVVFYALLNAGAPVGAPTILCAPPVNAPVLLQVDYIPVVPSTTLANIGTDTNPVPGESDKALVEYVIAFARVKDREDRGPDPEHVAIYATEKRNLLTALTPRSDQDPENVESFFQDDVYYTM